MFGLGIRRPKVTPPDSGFRCSVDTNGIRIFEFTDFWIILFKTSLKTTQVIGSIILSNGPPDIYNSETELVLRRWCYISRGQMYNLACSERRPRCAINYAESYPRIQAKFYLRDYKSDTQTRRDHRHLSRYTYVFILGDNRGPNAIS